MIYCSTTLLDNGTQHFIFKGTVIASPAVSHGRHTSFTLNPKQVFQCEVPILKVFSNKWTLTPYTHFVGFKPETHSALLDLHVCFIDGNNASCFVFLAFVWRKMFLACSCTILGFLTQSSYLIAVAVRRSSVRLACCLSGASGYAGRSGWDENVEEGLGEESQAAQIKAIASHAAIINMEIFLFRLLRCHIYKNKMFWEELNTYHP